MNEKDWEILNAIYEEKNITRAAQKLFLSQPALTYRINQLEEEFKIKIFVRGKKFVKFTTEGEYLAQYAKKMKNELIKLKDQLGDIKESVSGELRIGASSNFATYELPEILKRFHDLYPKVQFNIQTGPTTPIIESLVNEKFHIAIAGGEIDWKDSKILLQKDGICLISKEHIDLKDLPDLPRIKFKMDQLSIRSDENWWQEHFSRQPLIGMEVDKVETCKEMVLKGLGYAIVPEFLIEKDKNNTDLFIKPLSHSDGRLLLRNIWAHYYEDDLNLSFVAAFIDFLKEYYSINKKQP